MRAGEILARPRDRAFGPAAGICLLNGVGLPVSGVTDPRAFVM